MFLRALVLGWCLCCCGALAVNEASGEGLGLRLVGGGGRCRGQLQIRTSGQNWTGVNPVSVPLSTGHKICAELDCGSAVSVRQITVSQRQAVYLTPNKCWDTPLIHCFGSVTSPSTTGLEVNCSDSVRLVSGRTSCSGSLQIRDQSLNQSWTSVCEGALDRRGAEVLCRELGCGAPLLQGALSPLGQTFHCEGHESALMDCPKTDPGVCLGPHLNLTCSAPVRLVGGASRCNGTLEGRTRGQWRRMTIFGALDLETAAAVVCRDLDCGSAVSVQSRGGFDATDVWVVYAHCLKTAALTDCIITDRFEDGGLAVECSGKPTERPQKPRPLTMILLALIPVAVVVVIARAALSLRCQRRSDRAGAGGFLNSSDEQ